MGRAGYKNLLLLLSFVVLRAKVAPRRAFVQAQSNTSASKTYIPYICSAFRSFIHPFIHSFTQLPHIISPVLISSHPHQVGISFIVLSHSSKPLLTVQRQPGIVCRIAVKFGLSAAYLPCLSACLPTCLPACLPAAC